MSDEPETIPIDADDFKDVKGAIFDAEEGASAAIAELNRLREDLAYALGLAAYEWHKAPHEVRAALEAMEECLRPIPEYTDDALRLLLKAERGAEREAAG